MRSSQILMYLVNLDMSSVRRSYPHILGSLFCWILERDGPPSLVTVFVEELILGNSIAGGERTEVEKKNVTTRPVGTTCPVGPRLTALQRTDPRSIGDSLSSGNAVKGAVSLGPTEQVVPTGLVVTKNPKEGGSKAVTKFTSS
ncbi:hypothetical protein DY000_02000087 [Brassica cretica]|uniref:Uncharacterized protein n=1 Tax=Brassica cretica TaxID=69181 RepID=A0ABQ7CCM7_BRACR|nr:hypothetical protein DY000_02000087 [Brassica cretica]